MASKLYKLNESGEIIDDLVSAEYVYAAMQDGWVTSLEDLAPEPEPEPEPEQNRPALSKKAAKKLRAKAKNDD